MPLISFKKPHPTIEVPYGANLMTALLEGGLPVASSCAGEGVCAKCKITIVKGEKNLSPEEDLEVFLKEKNKIPESVRISCQTRVLGDVEVDASYW